MHANYIIELGNVINSNSLRLIGIQPDSTEDKMWDIKRILEALLFYVRNTA